MDGPTTKDNGTTVTDISAETAGGSAVEKGNAARTNGKAQVVFLSLSSIHSLWLLLSLSLSISLFIA